MTAAPLLDLGPDPVRPPVGHSRRPAHGCNGCGARWDGLKFCHCAICHHTFSTVRNFDRHEPACTGCLDPADVGLVRSTRSAGVWCQPGSEKEITR